MIDDSEKHNHWLGDHWLIEGCILFLLANVDEVNLILSKFACHLYLFLLAFWCLHLVF